MLPLLLAAAAPLAQLAGSEIAKLIAGDDPATSQKGAAVAEALVSAASTVAGVPVTRPEEVAPLATAIASDPAKLAEFRAALADKLVKLVTLDNEDRASARAQTVDLAKAGSRIAWGAPTVSVVVLVTFGVVLYRVLAAPAGTDPNAALMLGALTTMASAVVSYWVGSSAGSKAKDDLLRR